MVICIPILYTDLLIEEVAQIGAVNQIERRLEIIRPLINEQEYHELRSEYRLIEGKKKLVAFLTKVENIANEKDLTLPELRLLGIKPP